MKKVNLFLVGAQKSGSTALAEYLSQHNDIEVSTPKAPNYFSDLFVKSYSLNVYEEYKRCFKKESKYLCDASDCYHADIDALEKIKTYNSDAKLIMAIRNPYKMLVSLHEHLLWAGYEDIDDLNEAWSLQGERRNGELLPKYCPSSSFLDYKSLCSVGEHSRNAVNIFGRSNVLFIKTSNLKNNPIEVMKDITAFLEIDQPLEIKAVSSNEAVRAKFKFLTVLNRNIPPYIKVWVKNILLKIGFNIDGKFKSLNGIKITKGEEAYPFSDHIKESINNDIDLLSECLDESALDWKL